MAWNDKKRAYYFGCECSPGLAEADQLSTGCVSGTAADTAFRARYCAPNRRPSKKLITGTETRLKGVPIAVARCVISELTKWLPDADHSTPGWNWPENLKPAVVIGHLDEYRRIRGLRCGLWACGGKLYFWADKNLFEGLGMPTLGWVDYGHPEKPGDPLPMLRYDEPLSCLCAESGEVALPGPVVDLLQAFDCEIVPSGWLNGPLVPRDISTAKAAAPGAAPWPDGDVYDPDEEAADPHVGVPRDTDDNRCNNDASHSLVARAEACLDEEITNAITTDRSMLAVLRAVLIARIRTQLPSFGQSDLNDLILATGYPPARAPGSDIADLVFVMAASITNAAGGRPDWKEFGPATVEAMRAGGALGTHCLATDVPVCDLAHWFAALRITRPNGGWTKRMDRFLTSAAKFARLLPGDPVPLDKSILQGLAGFCEWLRRCYQGDARLLHQAMAANAMPGHNLALRLMEDLETNSSGIGVAIAANFLKDSQVPPLVVPGAHPSAMAQFEAGWSAKPDLHVLRFMAKLTRGMELHEAHKRQSLQVALRSFEGPPYAGAGAGFFPNSYPFANGRREYRAIEDIHHWADAVKTSALEIERVLYMIGATRLEISTPQRTATVSAAWYRRAEAAIDQALAAGVPRMS